MLRFIENSSRYHQHQYHQLHKFQICRGLQNDAKCPITRSAFPTRAETLVVHGLPFQVVHGLVIADLLPARHGLALERKHFVNEPAFSR